MGFPHTRGGGPMGLAMWKAWKEFSPHAWGWTFCACQTPDKQKFSPHAWGWTVSYIPPSFAIFVFPTRVGVDR